MIPWLQIVLPVVVGMLTAGGAFLGVRHSVRGNDRATEQREFAARREEWWRRFTWAAELSLDDSDAKQEAGLLLLAELAKSDLAQREECLLLYVFQARLLDPVMSEPADLGEEASRP